MPENDISINLFPEGGGSGFDKILAASKEITIQSEITLKNYIAMGGKVNTSGIDQQLKAQKELLKIQQQEEIAIKKLAQEEQKLANLKQQNSIKATNQAAKEARDREAGIKRVQSAQQKTHKATQGWSDALSSYQFKFNMLADLVAVGIEGMGKAIWGFAKESMKAYRDNENAMDKLVDGTGNNITKFYELKEAAKNFANTSIYSVAQISEQMAFLAGQNRSTEQIENTMEAAKKLADLYNIDLDSAVKKLDATFEGNVKGLGKLDAGFKTMTKSQLENGAAIDLINKKYADWGGLDTASDRLMNAKNKAEEFQILAGASLSKFVDDITIAAAAVLDLVTVMAKLKEGEKVQANIAMIEEKRLQYVTKLVQVSKQGSLEERQAATHKLIQLKDILQAELDASFKTQFQDSARYKKAVENMLWYTKAVTKGNKEIIETEIDKNDIIITDSIDYYKNKISLIQKELDAESSSTAKYKTLKLELYQWEAKLDALTGKNKDKYKVIIKDINGLEKIHVEYLTKETIANQQLINQQNILNPNLEKRIKTIDDLNEVYENGTIKQYEYMAAGMKMADGIYNKPKEKKEDIGLDSILSSMGVSDEQMPQIKDALTQAQTMYTQFLDARVAAAQTDISNSTKRKDELINLLNAEVQLNQQGYASNIQLRLQQIAKEDEIRNKAIEKEKKAAKERQTIANVEVLAATLITIANIFKDGVQEAGIWGVIAAGVATAGMLATMAANKSTAESTMKLNKGKIDIGRPKGSRKGEDSILALLTPHESIVNEKGTEMYNSVLHSVNEHQPPKKVFNSLINDANKLGGDNFLAEIASNTRQKTTKQIIYNNTETIEIEGNRTRIMKKTA